ncbi:dihydrolipoamide acetyltransferase family protein [Streptomyces sp. TP-A0874]|uniref:dihydrolipoamide acetyltransferase family protein n=1 Tax=Streptomyces sp. TP-A0874 TaxID=549819 RepID=UPI0008534E62|nr:dihydrolipoamide acetyltransferase family protein [Streptomyces sp. TP-A0874]
MTEVREFALPDLGEGLTEAEIVRWLVRVGEVVAVDQPVVEVETAKAMVEVPCPHAGVVTARFGEEGTELPVGAPLLTVAVGADSSAAAAAKVGPPAASAETVGERSTGPSESSGNVLVGYGTGAPSARRRRVRPAAFGDRGPGTAMRTARPGTVDGPLPVISPLVRRLAREHGLDLRQVTGSGPEGLILRADVESAARTARTGLPDGAVAPAGSPQTDPVGTGREPVPGSGGLRRRTALGSGAEERLPLRGLRGAVAEKLTRSRREIPDATTWVDADATELLAARAAMNAVGGPKVSLLALLARICTAALVRFPALNATVDTDSREIVVLPSVHLGFAAQTDRGLVVPVVRDAQTRDAVDLSAEFARLTEAGRTGRLTPADLTGGTFTLNNYGVFGVDGSTPIINHPEAAMLGVGRITDKPWVFGGELAVRKVVQLSLTFDHRVCDGGTAGGFLRHVADCVEQPAVLLRSL